MVRRPLAALFVAVAALAACRQIIGLEDRPGIHEAGTTLVTAQDGGGSVGADVDAGPATTFCTYSDASFCDDFEDLTRDAGWDVTVDPVFEGGPPVGTLDIGAPGRDSAIGLHVAGRDASAYGFFNDRLNQSFPGNARTITLSFAVMVRPGFYLADPTQKVQLGLLIVPGAVVFPVLVQGRLFIQHTSGDGGEVEDPSAAAFDAGVWHTIKIRVDSTTSQPTIRVLIDGASALDAGDFLPAGDASTVDIGVGLRFQHNAGAIDVRYDDVTLDLQ